jgi:hypothetical protein
MVTPFCPGTILSLVEVGTSPPASAGGLYFAFSPSLLAAGGGKVAPFPVKTINLPLKTIT